MSSLSYEDLMYVFENGMDELWPTIQSQFSVFLIVLGVLVVLEIVATWIIFVKAGQGGWKAIIPFYNVYTFFKILGGNGWAMFLLLIPIFGQVYAIITLNRFARAFGHGTGYTAGLYFLPLIFELIIAFSKAKYQGVQA